METVRNDFGTDQEQVVNRFGPDGIVSLPIVFGCRS